MLQVIFSAHAVFSWKALKISTTRRRKADVERMIYDLKTPIPVIYEDIFIFVDPAAGGPGSDYGIMSVTRSRGILVVSVRFILLKTLDEIYSFENFG